MFLVTEQGRTYQVEVRGAFRHSVQSERKLRQILNDAMVRRFGAAVDGKHSIFQQDALIGVISTKVPVER